MTRGGEKVRYEKPELTDIMKRGAAGQYEHNCDNGTGALLDIVFIRNAPRAL